MTQLLDDIRKAAEITSTVLLELKGLTKPGANLEVLDAYANLRIKELGAVPVLLGYQPKWAKTPFPATCCMSVDYEVAHGVPNKRELQEGQVIKYDLAVKYGSGHGDAALTVAVGEIDNFKSRLMRFGYEALAKGMEKVKAGVPVSEIGRAIEDYCIIKNLEVIRDFAGHHIGKEVHEEPHIPHYYMKENESKLLEEGNVICIEPMITRAGYAKIGIGEDLWTAYQVRGQPVVQFEHMVLVKKDGYEVLTTWDK